MAHEPIPAIERNYAVANIPVTGQVRAGAARVDITPSLGVAIAGYGFFLGKYARCFWGRLRANVLVIDDGAGERVALVATDLHTGTRYLVERIAQRVAPSTGLRIDRIVLAASHTHAGPGHIYGARHSDAMVANGKGFDIVTAEYLAERIASAIEVACQGLQPARIGYGSHPCWGYLINRSLRAAVRNVGITKEPYSPADEAKIRNLAHDLNEAHPPAGLHPRRQVVDARVHCIWAGKEGNGDPIGVFALLGTHTCLTTKKMKIMTPDAFGIAARVARERIWEQYQIRPPVGLVAGAQGDSNLVVPGMKLGRILRKRKDPDVALGMAEEVGRAVGEALAEAAEKARQDSLTSTDPTALEVYFDAVSVKAPWVNNVGMPVAPEPHFGIPTLGASEFNRGITSCIFREGLRRFWRRADPQYPKLLMPWLLRVIRRARAGNPPEMFPLRAIKVGRVWIATVPGEPTSAVGLAIRDAIRRVRGVEAPVMVAGLSGEYCNYVTMPAEYDGQHYEGSSTPWGRQQGKWLVDQIKHLIEGKVRNVPNTPAVFDGFIKANRWLFPNLLSLDPFGHDRRRFRVSVEDRTTAQGQPRRVLRFEGAWEAGPHGALSPVGKGPWLVLEWKSPTGYRPLEWKGEVVDDQQFPFLVTRKPSLFHITWRWVLEMDWDPAWAGREVRFRITAPEPVKGFGGECSPSQVIPTP